MREESHSDQVTTSGCKRIGIFGGSFDPIHEGHTYLASLARNAADLDEVWFMPCKISPHKLDTPPSSAQERVDALKVAIRNFSWAKIDLTELEADGPSYSYRTLEKLKQRFPEHEWFWIMGGDQWAMLSKWMHPDRLAAMASFIVMVRNGVVAHPMPGYRMQVVEGEHPASSTQIREALARNQREIPYLDPEVESLIRAQRPIL